jgi:uncharacterized protein YukJ
MSIPGYGVWVAKATCFHVEDRTTDPRSPHIYLYFTNGPASARAAKFQAAINVKSSGAESRLVYWFNRNFNPELTDSLVSLDYGFHPLESPDGLDYSRGNLVDFRQGRLLPHDIEGPDNDILDELIPVLQAAVDKGAKIYIFGVQYDDRKGIHNIHMNQGSLPQFDNGVGQDGGILLRFEETNGEQNGHWDGVFLAFASQKVPTNDQGRALPNSRSLKDVIEA